MPLYVNTFDKEFVALNGIAAEDTILIGVAPEDTKWQYNNNGNYPISNPQKKNNGE